MSNNDFVSMMTTETKEREPWSKVRWINIGGISWDVMSSLAVKHGVFWHRPTCLSMLTVLC